MADPPKMQLENMDHRPQLTRCTPQEKNETSCQMLWISYYIFQSKLPQIHRGSISSEACNSDNSPSKIFSTDS